ncbi:MAG: PHP-associated domain-containing protein, partial [Bradymonadaceae bacterium]
VEQKKDDFAVEAATYLGKPTVGGSDPEASTDAIGRYGTFFDGTFSTQSELVDALRDGSYWAVEIG